MGSGESAWPPRTFADSHGHIDQPTRRVARNGEPMVDLSDSLGGADSNGWRRHPGRLFLIVVGWAPGHAAGPGSSSLGAPTCGCSWPAGGVCPDRRPALAHRRWVLEHAAGIDPPSVDARTRGRPWLIVGGCSNMRLARAAVGECPDMRASPGSTESGVGVGATTGVAHECRGGRPGRRPARPGPGGSARGGRTASRSPRPRCARERRPGPRPGWRRS
jgi:hypothetical protein